MRIITHGGLSEKEPPAGYVGRHRLPDTDQPTEPIHRGWGRLRGAKKQV